MDTSNELPAIARRWLDRSLAGTASLEADWQLDQHGELQFRPGRWAPWRGRQTMSPARTSFSWRVRLTVVPRFLWLCIDDGCDEDEGWGRARLWGLFKSIDEHGPHLFRTQVSRYLTDLPFAPHAALAGHLEWRADGRDAVWVGVPAGERLGGAVEARLVFNDDADVIGAMVPDRPRKLPDSETLVDTPFRVGFAAHTDVGGLRMPTRAEAGFEPDGAAQPLMRIRITDAREVPSDT